MPSFPKWLYQFALPPALHEGSGCSVSLEVLSFLNSSHSSGYKMVSDYSSNWHFPDD